MLSIITISNREEEEEEEEHRLGVVNHWLSHYMPRVSMKCNKVPRICHAKGSPGPDCCKKHCVNVLIDNLNCGECGRKCRYGQICCHGNCVNIMYDVHNCGGCKIKCNKAAFCRFGMCNYA